MRDKYCEICKNSFSTMFRIQHKSNKNWVFVCEQCVISVKKKTHFTNMGVHGKNKIKT